MEGLFICLFDFGLFFLGIALRCSWFYHLTQLHIVSIQHNSAMKSGGGGYTMPPTFESLPPLPTLLQYRGVGRAELWGVSKQLKIPLGCGVWEGV